jgi:hypothetical protein
VEPYLGPRPRVGPTFLVFLPKVFTISFSCAVPQLFLVLVSWLLKSVSV